MKVIKNTPAGLSLALAVLALSTLGVVGGTWAYMAFQDSVEGTVSGAKISVAADMTAVATSSTISTYSGTGTFENNGTGKIENGALVIENMAEGDQADVTVTLTNTSTIDVAYRVSYETEGTLPLTVSVSDYEEWTTWTVANASTARTFTLTVVYPYSETPNYADGTGTFTITCNVETVQANAPIVNGGTTAEPEEPQEPEHTHTYDQESESVATAATCTTNQYNYYKCSCGEVGTTTYEVADTAGHGAVASIAVTTNPTKTAYTAGETFDKTGMVVTATCEKENCPTYAVTEYTVDKTEALTTADTTVTVTYGGKTATVAITVAEATEPEEPVDTTTLKLEAESATKLYYSDGSTWTPMYNSNTTYNNEDGTQDKRTGVYFRKAYNDDNTVVDVSKETVLEFTVTASEDVELDLAVILWHRDGGTHNLADMFTFYVINGSEEATEVTTTATHTCTKTSGDYEEATVGKIALKAGENTIKIVVGNLYANLDGINLVGDTAKITEVATVDRINA